ncbi:hypothetical protein SDC9_78930 [bioreactor metagenome]|uniref:Uncharacterized protein n=1 Tax=bioreactor metagenome TaxID=1076179 RepID=A0A644YWH4_9ZZZZ
MLNKKIILLEYNEIILTQDDTLIYSEKVLVVIPQISFYLGKVELKTVRI